MEVAPKYKDLEHKKLLDSYRDSSHQTSSLVSFSIIDPLDPDIKKINEIIMNQNFSSLKESKALAMFIGSAIGDALGAHLECKKYNPNGYGITNFSDIEKKRFPLGQWTDDTAEALCLADSLLIHKLKFDPVDIRSRFAHWWFAGYNNGRKNENCEEKYKTSQGIGGYTLDGLKQFLIDRTPFVEKKDDRNTNGSIMRVTPIPIAFHFDITSGIDFAGKQSFCTHDGLEASECCRLLTFLGIKGLNHPEKGFKVAREILDLAGTEFKSELISVSCLSKSLKETDFNPYENSWLNKGLEDRDWNWKNKDFKYSQHRIQLRENLIGIYSMDCVAMALHILYHYEGFNKCLIKGVNLGGDADSLGGIIGMLTGAFYGFDGDFQEKYKFVQTWDESSIALKAYKLLNMRN